MYRGIPARRVAGILGGATLAAGSLLAWAPAAMAAPTTPQVKLVVTKPGQLGLGGDPVQFDVTITGTIPGTTDTTFDFDAETAQGMPADGLAMRYFDGGGWKPMQITYKAGTGSADTHFTAGTTTFYHVAQGKTATVHVSIGLPMGGPGHGDTNGGTPFVKLTTVSERLDASGATMGTPLATDTQNLSVGAPAMTLGGLPHTVTSGAGYTQAFHATLTDPTASAYDHTDELLTVDAHATVQALRHGTWVTLPKLSNRTVRPFGNEDNALGPGTNTTAVLRVAYDAATPAGEATLYPCVIVNEDANLHGTTFCRQAAVIDVVAAGATETPSSTATMPSQASATPTLSAPAPATSASGTLAETGGAGHNSRTGLIAGFAAAVLVAAGAGIMILIRSRRPHHL